MVTPGCIAKKFRRSLEDVRVKRGADATSSHHLVVAKLKLREGMEQVKKEEEHRSCMRTRRVWTLIHKGRI